MRLLWIAEVWDGGSGVDIKKHHLVSQSAKVLDVFDSPGGVNTFLRFTLEQHECVIGITKARWDLAKEPGFKFPVLGELVQRPGAKADELS